MDVSSIKIKLLMDIPVMEQHSHHLRRLNDGKKLRLPKDGFEALCITYKLNVTDIVGAVEKLEIFAQMAQDTRVKAMIEHSDIEWILKLSDRLRTIVELIAPKEQI